MIIIFIFLYGKSAFGNSICGSKERNFPFMTGISSSSITQKAKTPYRKYADQKLVVVDTPGLFDTKKSITETMEQLRIGFQLAAPGPHAFLIVVYGRYTNEDQLVFDILQKKFGQYLMDYFILIITHEDEVRNDDKHISDNEVIRKYFQEVPKKLQEFLIKCNNRFILINNRASFIERDRKISMLIDIIKQNEQDHANSFYNQEMFDQAERHDQEWNNDEFDHQRKEWENDEEEMNEKV
ncbi:unnamed protein product [Rotaria sp. Silwood2]|nr:unnamed protein product [Rotaria sp. Silwood2]